MTPEQYLDALMTLPAIYGPKVSPDGRYVAWTWIRTAPTTEVYAAPTDGSAAPIRLTDTPENTFFVSWTPDSRAVLVEQDKNGNERAQLFRVDLDAPLTLKPLTEEDPKFYLRGGRLHPNGKWLFYGANFDAATGQEIEQTWVYRHDLETGERVAIARPEKAGWPIPALNSTGTHVIYSRKDLHPSGSQVWLVDVEGQSDREIYNAGADVKAFGSWLSDGIHVLIQAETPTHTRLGVYDTRDGGLKWAIDDPKRNIEYVYTPENSSWIVVVEVQAARLISYLFNPLSLEEQRPDPVPGNLLLVGPAAGGDWVALHFSSAQPHDLVRVAVLDTKVENFASLSRVWERTSLTAGDFTRAEDFRWKAADDLEIQGWLYRAQGGAQGAARGTIVYVHGGPTAHSLDAINNQIQFFVRQGFNVLDPNYRGSTGFNLQFRDSIKEDGWGGREQDDIRAGIEALIEAGIAQRGKVGITGTSYGGYSSWHAITHFPVDVLAASAPVCGMTDLVIDYQTTRPDLRPYSEEMMGGTPDQVPQKYHDRSPVNFVREIKGRLLIIQGMQDPNVTPENVNTVTQALQEAGVEYEIVAFDDEGHGIIKPKNQRALYPQLAQFFATAFDSQG